ncbi:MAG: cytochrome c oxidase assembly protein [Sphingomonadales bacterium 32-68-7]|nr:MAG: cytochrome c oxidase assembly protein [Sphingomonadales bacterium 12-68-11]OYX07564.1 MAG: cytochrome c oxidase assembly protein [Sphingomonadales bacterium 32-68-7]
MASAALARRNLRVGLIALAGAVAMLGLGFAAVPLYRLFCQVTGFGGTTQRATEAEALSAEQFARSAGAPVISIRFDANTDANMPWSFRPVQVTDKVQIGQRDMAIYEARNESSVPVTGTASFNVEPEQAGKYFHKVQCFCFTEQTLRPGQMVHMPVIYFVDPKALDDPNMKGVEQITLSYTFHRTKGGEEPASTL